MQRRTLVRTVRKHFSCTQCSCSFQAAAPQSLLVYFSARRPHGVRWVLARGATGGAAGFSMFQGARRAIGNGRMRSRALIIMLACAHGWTGVHGWTGPARALPMSRPRCATLSAIEGAAEEAPRPARSSSGPRLQGGNQRPLGIDPANRIKQVVRDTSLPLRVELLRSRLPEGCATTTGA